MVYDVAYAGALSSIGVGNKLATTATAQKLHIPYKKTKNKETHSEVFPSFLAMASADLVRKR